MNMLHDFLLIMLGVVLSAVIVSTLAYLLLKGVRLESYNEGYMDGFKDAKYNLKNFLK